jgi:enoyl-CoA hydratase/carnithine racemase
MRLGFPTIAAMDGHCHAGGFMFAMAHDYRLFRDSGVTMSMSEINLNIPIPKNMMGPLLAKMNKPALREICLFGTKMDGKQALKYEIVDKIFPTVNFIYFELIFVGNSP